MNVLRIASSESIIFRRLCQVASVTTVASILSGPSSSSSVGKRVKVNGWVKASRKQKNATFIDISDGSCSDRLQVIVATGGGGDAHSPHLAYHSCVSVEGTVAESKSPDKQEIELIADRIEVVAEICDKLSSGKSYPFRPRNKYQSEYTRQFPMFRAKLDDFAALLRVRNVLSQSIHRYFQDEGFVQIQTPLLTDNDCEGAGETFVVCQRNNSNLDHSEGTAATRATEMEYFDKTVYLTVSGQLHLEAMCNGLGKVYNFSPVFRAERGKTRRHLSEFTMVEAEEAFVTTTEMLVARIERMLKWTIKNTLDTNTKDLNVAFSQGGHRKSNLDELSAILNSNFTVMGYDEAFEVLNENASMFQQKPVYGELGKEHELYLTEKHCASQPVFVVDWPTSSKPFYVAREGDIAKAVDLIFPFVGEVVGGSLREHNANVLKAKLNSMTRQQQQQGLNKRGDNEAQHSTLQWYLDLRLAGSPPTGGFGLGFERLVQFMLGVNNIRDTLPFPRSPHQCLL